MAHNTVHRRRRHRHGSGALARRASDRRRRGAPRSHTGALRGPALAGRSPQGRRLHYRQSQARDGRCSHRRGCDSGPDRRRRHRGPRRSLAAYGLGRALARTRGDRHGRRRGGHHRPAPLAAAHLPHRGCLRLQPHDALDFPGRSRQRNRARGADRGATGAGGSRADGSRRPLVVAGGIRLLARSDAAHHLGVARLHCAALQQVLAARGCFAQRPHRGTSRALRLSLEWRFRRRRLPPVCPRQCLLHRHRQPQAHRVLRYPPQAIGFARRSRPCSLTSSATSACGMSASA